MSWGLNIIESLLIINFEYLDTGKIKWTYYWLWSTGGPGMPHWWNLSWGGHTSLFTGRALYRLLQFYCLNCLCGMLVNLDWSDFTFSIWQGVAEINMLLDRLAASRQFRGHLSEWLLPLHSSIAPEDQRKVFSNPPDNIRKVVFHVLLHCSFLLGLWYKVLNELSIVCIIPCSIKDLFLSNPGSLVCKAESCRGSLA